MSGFGETINQTVNEAVVTQDEGEFTKCKDNCPVEKSDQDNVYVEHKIVIVRNETFGHELKVKEENNNYIEIPIDQTHQTHHVKCETFDDNLTVTNSPCEIDFLKATGSFVDQLNEIKHAKFQSYIKEVNQNDHEEKDDVSGNDIDTKNFFEENGTADSELNELKTGSTTNKIKNEQRGVKKSVNKTVQRKQYVCEVCNDEFSCKSVYVSHKRKSHGIQAGCEYMCDVCSKVFTRRHHLERHAACHDTKRAMFPCRYCPKELASRSTRNDHERSHTGEKPYVCDICSLAFGRAQMLNTHKKREHSDPYICDSCGRSFTLKRNLLKHIPVHTRERQWKCGFCDKAFLAKYTRHRHERRFHRDRLPCDACDLTFGSKGALKKHKWAHRDRPYKCDQCRVSFDQNCNLTKHKVLHSAVKPHKCAYCDHAYAHRSNLNKHIKAAHPRFSLVAVKNVE